MGKANFAEEFKQDAVKQITKRGYSVADVSKRLWVSSHSLYGWIKRYGALGKAPPKDDQTVEIRRLKRELARVTEERDILKIDEACRPRISPEIQSEVRVHQSTSYALQYPGHMPYASCQSEWLLCLAEAATQQACFRRCAPDGTA